MNVFTNQPNLQRAIFVRNISKDVASLIEALLILSLKVRSSETKNLLNRQYEIGNLQLLKDPNEAFHTKVFLFFY